MSKEVFNKITFYLYLFVLFIVDAVKLHTVQQYCPFLFQAYWVVPKRFAMWVIPQEISVWSRSLPRPLLAVQKNVTDHPSTASVAMTVLLYSGPLLCSLNVAIKGLM